MIRTAEAPPLSWRVGRHQVGAPRPQGVWEGVGRYSEGLGCGGPSPACAMAPSTCVVLATAFAVFIFVVVLSPETRAQELEVALQQGEGGAEPSGEVEFLRKRASNLGSRLMCRNCGAFNMGKKFGGYSWLRSADSTRRRLEYFLANKWQRGEDTPSQLHDTGDDYWQGSYN